MAERGSSDLTIINRLPDEVLLEIFDLYRQSTGIDQYDYDHWHLWRKKYAWFNLAHVCRRWRAVMFESSTRLDLNIVVGPKKPGNIRKILSGHLPILINYLERYGPLDTITGSALWRRMRAALGHRDRVREISISFEGGFGVMFDNFINATTNCHFPALESLVLYFPDEPEGDIPATFLRGPDRSDPPLRRLGLYETSLASVSGLLLSATALTDLTLSINAADFDPSQGPFLLSCLQGMQSLRNLELTIFELDDFDFQSQDSITTPKDIVRLLKLTRFHYSGPATFLNSLMSGLSAPSLQDARFDVDEESPLLYLSRAIDDVSGEFPSVSVTFGENDFHLVSSTHSGEIDHFKPTSFRLNVNCSWYSFDLMNSTPSTKLAMAEELTLNFPSSNLTNMEDFFSLREFLRQFRSVRLLRVNPFVWPVGRNVKQDDDGEAIFPVLEQVELSISRRLPRYSTRYSANEYQRRGAEALAVFEPCERAGRLVKVCYCEQTQTQSRNARSW
jgi:hypothetical protein